MFYTPSHEWISVEGDIGTVGITLYAKQELGEIVFIDLPKIGAKLVLGQELAVVESTKAAADIYSPITGQVVEVNTALLQGCELINTSPEGAGWLCRLKIENMHELDTLQSSEGYKSMTGC